MKCYAYDMEHEYYFCSANQRECEKILRPFLRIRREIDKDTQYDQLFSSSEDFLDECIQANKEARLLNRYTSRTLNFTLLFDESPDEYIYFVINSNQDEFYIVPFYTPLSQVWSDYNPFQKIDSFEFKSLLELISYPVTKDGKELERKYLSFNRADLNDMRFKILTKIHNREVTTMEEVYSLIYPVYQNYQIFYGEFIHYFSEAHCYLPPIFHHLDQMNLHLLKDYFSFIPKEKLLSYEKERLQNEYGGDFKYVFWDFLDKKIPLSIFKEITNIQFCEGTDLTEDEIRKELWFYLLSFEKRRRK